MSSHAEESPRTDVLRASPRMFDSTLLDKLSRVHWSVVPALYGPAIAILFVLGVDRLGPIAVLWAALGYALWTLTEYWLHRIVFHFEPDHPIGRRFHFIIHGVHHDHPNDPLRLVMPPGASIPLALLFYGLWLVVFGAERAPAVMAGFLTGYLAYDMLHYAVHHHRPQSRFGRYLRELHMRHHFQDDTRGFGVSAPWWDHVFRTAPRRRRRGTAA